MKKDSFDHQVPAPRAPTAKAVLAQLADKLSMGVTTMPAPPADVASGINQGLSIAAAMIDDELDKLATAAPRDNPAHRALFALPPIALSDSTAVAVPEMPAQKVVTGDTEVDAVLWLRELIRTGQADLIAKAKEAATRIKTSLKELEKRYRDHLVRANPQHGLAAALSSFGFDDLDGLAVTAVSDAARRQEAHARFGDTLFAPTMAEQVCEEALFGLKRNRPFWEYEAEEVDARFDALEAQRPGTLTDCVLELNYWCELHWLRRAVDKDCIDDSPEVNARQDYVFRLLSRIPPRDAAEAADVLLHLQSNDGMDRAHTGAIILNLIGAPEPYQAKREAGHA